MPLKLSRHAFTRYWDVHAWSGVVGGLVLYLMFLTGSVTLFHQQLRVWEEPLLQRPVASSSPQAALEQGLQGAGPVESEVWFYPAGPERAVGKLSYQRQGETEWKQAWIDDAGHRLVPQRERLTSFLYSLHFLWHDVTGDWLYYLAGLLAIVMLLAILTGVLIHLKDLARQFHQFRPHKSPRVMWSDLHKVLGVMGLPFQLMYAYTGAFIVLSPFIVDVFTGPVLAGDKQKAAELSWGGRGTAAAEPGPKVPGLGLNALLEKARLVAPGLGPDVVKVSHHGHANATVEVRGPVPSTPEGRATVRLRETDGSVLYVATPNNEGAAAVTRRWVLGLHFAEFGGLALRFLFFALGLASCATLLTGNWIWLVRRQARHASLGNRLLARLTAGVGVGSLVAVAALFLISRLLPLDLSHRGTLEELVFLGVLFACVLWGLLVRQPGALWWQGLGLAGVLLAPVPLLAARISSAGLFGNGPRTLVVTGVDIALAVTSIGLCCAALGLRRLAKRTSVASDESGPDAADLPQTAAMVAAEGGDA